MLMKYIRCQIFCFSILVLFHVKKGEAKPLLLQVFHLVEIVHALEGRLCLLVAKALDEEGKHANNDE